MKTAELKKEIECLAKSENITFIQACQALQSAAATAGDENLIYEIHKIKMSSIKN